MRDLSMGENQAILKMRKRKSVRTIAKVLGIANKNNNLEYPEKERKYWHTLSNRHRNARPLKTKVEDTYIMRAVRKDSKTWVRDITNNVDIEGVKVSQHTVRRRTLEEKYSGHSTKCKPHISSKNFKGQIRIFQEVKSWATKFLEVSFTHWWDQVESLLKWWNAQSVKKESICFNPKYTWDCLSASGAGLFLFIKGCYSWW